MCDIMPTRVFSCVCFELPDIAMEFLWNSSDEFRPRYIARNGMMWHA